MECFFWYSQRPFPQFLVFKSSNLRKWDLYGVLANRQSVTIPTGYYSQLELKVLGAAKYKGDKTTKPVLGLS